MVSTNTCNYKYGSKTCDKPCHRTKGNNLRSKCAFHLNKATRKTKFKLMKKREETGEATEFKQKINVATKLRMSKYREVRLKAIDAVVFNTSDL